MHVRDFVKNQNWDRNVSENAAVLIEPDVFLYGFFYFQDGRF